MISSKRIPFPRRFCSGILGILVTASAGAAELASPPQSAVDAAIATQLIRFNRSISGGAHTNGAWHGGASITLAVASYAGNTTADTRLLQQIRYTLTAGNEPTSNGGYPSQHEKNVTGMFTIVKHTPRIWDQLTTAEKTRIDLIMKATFIASAFTTGDYNPYVQAGSQQYAIDGDSNLDRGWNPNYREGMVGGVLVGMAYFGGPAPAEAILASYNHAQFLSSLSANNLPNIHETFNWKAANPTSGAPSGTAIENAVKVYRHYGKGLGDYTGIYELLNSDTYQKNVNAGLNNGAGVNGAGKIASGAATLPNSGAPGMLKEFDSGDSGGPRSSFIYAYFGFRPHMINQLALIVSGFWPKGSAIATAAVARQNIGNTDLWYKADHGYIGYSKGASEGLASYDTIGVNYGFVYNRAMWENVLKPYHDLPGGEDPPPAGPTAGSRIETGADAQVHQSASSLSPLTGFLPSGSLGTLLDGPVIAGGIDWWHAVFDNSAVGWIAAGDFTEAPASEALVASPVNVWRNLSMPPQTGNFIVSFNMSPGAPGIDGVTGLSTSAASAYPDLAVAVRCASSGRVDARNGGAYAAENALTYEAGTIYRVVLTVNLTNHAYSATVTPAGGTSVVIASNYAFRTGQATVTSLGNLAAVSSSGPFTVTGLSLGPPATRPGTPTGVSHRLE